MSPVTGPATVVTTGFSPVCVVHRISTSYSEQFIRLPSHLKYIILDIEKIEIKCLGLMQRIKKGVWN